MKMMICPACWGSDHDPVDLQKICAYCLAHGVVQDELLSDHFWLSEFLRSDTAAHANISNAPPAAVIDRLRKVAVDLLEPLRDHFGPIHVSSGYRSPELNTAVRGSSKTSVHPLGFAADLSAVNATRKEVVDYAIGAKLPFDQVIFEGSWVHISRFAPDGVSVRGQKLMMFPAADGKPGYHPYDPRDPRVVT